MAAPFGYGLFQWVIKHPWVLAIPTVLIWLKLRDNRLETKHRRDQDRKHREAQEQVNRDAVEFTETQRKEAAHDADQALEARDTAEPLDSSSMCDAQFERIFGHPRTPEQVS